MNEMAFSLALRLVALCLIPLVTCESVWTKDYYQTLTNKWDRCKFLPNGTRTDDILGICTRNFSSSTHEDEALRGIKYLCSLFERFSNDICDEAIDIEIEETSKVIKMLWSDTTVRKFYRLCDGGDRFKIPESVKKSVMKMLSVQTCTLACSALNAEKLCQLVVILSIADNKHMEEAVKDPDLTPTPETQTTMNNPAATTSNTTSEGSTADPTATPEMKPNTTVTPTKGTKLSTETQTKTTTTEAKDTPTPEPAPTTNGEATKRNETEAPQKVVEYEAGYVTTGQLAIYGIFFSLLCAIVFATYKYRHSILSCLRESRTGGPPGNDGKGGYRKVPNFERVLPNMEDREKAKSFIY